jgi:hypothetical protein
MATNRWFQRARSGGSRQATRHGTAC